MTSATNPHFTPAITTFGDGLTELMDSATDISRAYLDAYLDGLNTIIDQQELVNQAARQWFSETGTADPAPSEPPIPRAAPTGGTAPEATATPVKPTRKTRRRSTSPASKSALASALQPGPAKWTSEGYESLTAAEIISRLPQFSQRELDEVEAFEKAHQARETILQRITSLRAEEPIPGYDELTVPEVLQHLSQADPALAARVREYERTHKNRDGAMKAAEVHLSDS